MSSKKIIIITDSTAMPRDGIVYEDTYIKKLKEEFSQFDFIDKSARGSTSFRLISEGGGGVDLLETYMPDLAIIQLGITDCAPRLTKKSGFEFFLINKILPKNFRQKYINYVKKNRGRNPRLTDISPANFKLFFELYCRRAEKIGCYCLIILIAPPTKNFIEKSPMVGNNIKKYNEILLELKKSFRNIFCIDPALLHNDINKIMIDELHYNKLGYALLHKEIKKKIDKWLEK